MEPSNLDRELDDILFADSGTTTFLIDSGIHGSFSELSHLTDIDKEVPLGWGSRYSAPFSNPAYTRSEIAMVQEIRDLKARVTTLEEQLALVQSDIYEDGAIELREISREQAIKEIRELFATGETLFYSDIAARLALDLQTVVEICSDLQDQGDI